MTTPITYPKTINNYEILDELGHGAFSTVCKCINTTTRAQYACKIFPKNNLLDEGDRERFQREINTMAYLRHDNLVSMYDFFWDDLNFYLIIDFCPGGELFDYIVKHDKLNEPDAALIFQQIASAIAYSHSFGVAHRDLKPENVLISKFPKIKVSDFGLCGFISNEKMMKTFCGSPCYCAPECLSRIQYDGRLSDIWSLGVILFAMVTGEHPWNISNTSIMLRQILKGSFTVPSFVSPKCKELIVGMIRVDPHQRFTMDQILSHPWMKSATKSKIAFSAGIKIEAPKMPQLQTISLQEISEASARSSKLQDSGIFSPFQGGENDEGMGNSINRLCVRSASVENFNQQESINGMNNGRRRFAPSAGRISLVQNRQRSTQNMLNKIPKSVKINTSMMTIAEE
ncbi:CAMK family protein kinase [Tritrichomonas foetus]|uniref:CAMK family protein kinase n=1 Tax=Tritrichomonas foetus TaxID=1144522 RepID=A0A1J4L2Q8_9EUKA|nr:CAMK family protein kinase [Tritrichomonas foetus]|eukprot:OHT16181.1 CAMK family protein kinase [Tritrichomonas foetus]